jgi:hypothetical protein
MHELLEFDKNNKQGNKSCNRKLEKTKDVDQILIHCSEVFSSYQNNPKSHEMDSKFFINLIIYY